MFFGIIVRMYCDKSEHNPPHVHVFYQNHSAVIDIRRCTVTGGSLPTKQTRLVLAWMELHKEELLANWELASKGELPFKIKPLE